MENICILIKQTAETFIKIFVELVLLICRYCDALVYGFRSYIASKAGNKVKQQILYRMMLDEDSDASLLRLFHCFLFAAPQAIVQLMILISTANLMQKSHVQGKLCVFVELFIHMFK